MQYKRNAVNCLCRFSFIIIHTIQPGEWTLFFGHCHISRIGNNRSKNCIKWNNFFPTICLCVTDTLMFSWKIMIDRLQNVCFRCILFVFGNVHVMVQTPLRNLFRWSCYFSFSQFLIPFLNKNTLANNQSVDAYNHAKQINLFHVEKWLFLRKTTTTIIV